MQYIEIPVIYPSPVIKSDDNDLSKFGYPGLVEYLIGTALNKHPETTHLFRNMEFTNDTFLIFEDNTLAFIWSKENLYKAGFEISTLAACFTELLEELQLGTDFEMTSEKTKDEDGKEYIKLIIKFTEIFGTMRDDLLGLLRIKGYTSSIEELKNWMMRQTGVIPGTMEYTFTGCTSLKYSHFPIKLNEIFD